MYGLPCEGWSSDKVFQSGWGSILVVGISPKKRFLGLMGASWLWLVCLFFCFFFSGEVCGLWPCGWSLVGRLAGGGFVIVELVLVGVSYISTYGW